MCRYRQYKMQCLLIFLILFSPIAALPANPECKDPFQDFENLTITKINGRKKKTPNKYIELTCAPVGMFWTFMSVIGGLAMTEHGYFKGLEVNFGVDGELGTYYDANRGPNWWEYYFEPIQVGQKQNSQVLVCPYGPYGTHFSDVTEYHINRRNANRIINKYIHVKPHIQNIIDLYIATHFKEDHYIIGVHYRGTDKHKEAPLASYEEVEGQIVKRMARHASDRTQIFIATDEQGFLDYMIQRYPLQVVYYEAAIRSIDGNPVHLTSQDNYKKGEDALVDCILLSKCNVLMKTSSNLSLCSSYFNPDIRVVHLTLRHDGRKPKDEG